MAEILNTDLDKWS